MDILDRINALNEAIAPKVITEAKTIKASQLPDWAKKDFRKIKKAHAEKIAAGTHVMAYKDGTSTTDNSGEIGIKKLEDLKKYPDPNCFIVEGTIESAGSITREEAWKLMGNQSTSAIKNMVAALSMGRNTPEEKHRLEAAKAILKNKWTNPKFDTKKVNEGETKTATWMQKARELRYFDSRNTEVYVNCETLDKAKAFIKNSKIDQELKVQK